MSEEATPLDAKPQGAQLKRYTSDRGILREVKYGKYGEFVHFDAYAEAAERIEKLEQRYLKEVEYTRENFHRAEKAEQERDTALRALAETRRDAERYRWLRSTRMLNELEDDSELTNAAWEALSSPDDCKLDAAIDAARQTEKDANNG